MRMYRVWVSQDGRGSWPSVCWLIVVWRQWRMWGHVGP